MSQVPKQILSAAYLLEYGPSDGGYEGELQLLYALQQEYDKRIELEIKLRDREELKTNVQP